MFGPRTDTATLQSIQKAKNLGISTGKVPLNSKVKILEVI